MGVLHGRTGPIRAGAVQGPSLHRLRLHFMEPEPLRKGGRVFDVRINGKTVLAQLDIVAEAGAPNKAVVKDVKGIGPCRTIELSLKRVSGKPPLLCGIEAISQP